MRLSLKRLCILFLFLYSASSFSGGVTTKPPARDPFTGFHVGFETGLITGNFETESNNDVVNIIGAGGSFNQQNQSVHLATASPVGRFLMGYAWDFNRFYLGLNASGSFFKAVGSSFQTNNAISVGGRPSHSSNVVETTIQHSFAYSLLPGFLISPNTLLFAQIGGIVSNVKLRMLSQASYTDPANNANNSLNSSRSKTVLGVEAGIGMEQVISSHMAFMIQYLFTHYGQVSLNDFANFQNQPVFNNTALTQPSSNTFLVGLDIYFHRQVGLDETYSNLGNLLGFYLDAYGGVYHELVHYSSETDHRFLPGLTSLSQHQLFGDKSNNNLNGGIAIGYGYGWSRFYIGAVLSREFGHASSIVNSLAIASGTLVTTNQIKTTVKNQVNLDLKPGVLLGNKQSLLYALVGYTKRRIQLESIFIDPPVGATHARIDAESSTRSNGLRIGLGFMTKVTSHLAIGIQDIFTFYSVASVEASQSGTNSTAILKTSVTPRTNNITFHLSYFLPS